MMNIVRVTAACLVSVAWYLAPPPARAQAAEQSRTSTPTTAVLFDTGKPAASALRSDAVAQRAGWTALPDGKTEHRFRGDAALAGGDLTLVLRRGAPGAELYAHGAQGPALRAHLVPLLQGAGPKLTSLKVVQNNGVTAAVEATFEAAGKTGAMVFELNAVNRVVRTRSRGGASGLRVEAPTRLAVLPDFFADDMVIDARAVPIDRTEVPSEHFFMQLTGGGNAIVTSVWDGRADDVWLTLSGKGAERVLTGVEIPYGKRDQDGKPGSIWVAVLEQKGIWASVEVTDQNAGKRLTFDWEVPFRAEWKVDLMRADHTTDSWKLLFNPRTRQRWAVAVHRFTYPVWATTNRKTGVTKAHVESPRSNRGPVVVYPIRRTKDTPVDRYTIVDVMQRSLGVGPCAYIMDVEGQGIRSKGLYTCATYDLLAPLFESGRQKDERVTVNRILDEVIVFVHAIRQRIFQYVKFGDDLLAWLESRKKVHPDLVSYIDEMEKLTRVIRKRYERKKRCTQADIVKIAARLRASLTKDVPGVNSRGLLLAIRDGIGAPQDDLVAECRLAVKVLRQRAALDMVLNPKVAPIALEIRKRTRAILRNKYGHEGR